MNMTPADIVALEIPYMETTDFGDYTIKIERDDVPDDPRTWENLGTMVCWHSRYTLGDAHDFENIHNMFHELSGMYPALYTDGLTPEQLERCEENVRDTYIVLPVYLYDHSGITMNTTGFTDRWDSGQVGYIYVSYEKLREEHDWKNISPARAEQAAEWLNNEVKLYDHFITGNVYGFTIEKDDETVEACFGYYGDDDYMINEIKAYLKCELENTPQQLELFT